MYVRLFYVQVIHINIIQVIFCKARGVMLCSFHTYIDTVAVLCNLVCKNLPCPRKLHLVRYSTISPVVELLYKILHEFVHVLCKLHQLPYLKHEPHCSCKVILWL